MEPREAIVRSVPSIELPDGKTSGFKARPVFEQCFHFEISDDMYSYLSQKNSILLLSK